MFGTLLGSSRRSSPRPVRRLPLAVETLEGRDVPATWNYFGTGEGLASDPSNWLDGVAPYDGDNVTIPAATSGFNNDTLNQIGTLSIEDGWNQRFLSGPLFVGDGTVGDGAVFNLNGSLTFTGTVEHHNAEFDDCQGAGNDIVIAGSGAEVTIRGDKQPVINGNARNDGTVNFLGGTLRFGNPATPYTFTTNGAIVIDGGANVKGNFTLVQNGSGEIQQLSGASYFDSGLLNNGGHISHTAGNMTFYGKVTIPRTTTQVTIWSQYGGMQFFGGNVLKAMSGVYLQGTDFSVRIGSNPETGSTFVVLSKSFEMRSGNLSLGGINSGGLMTLSCSDGGQIENPGGNGCAVTLAGVTAEANLNWDNNSLDKMITNGTLSITDGIFAMGTQGEPSPVPQGRSWTAFSADKGITGDFGYYYIGSNYQDRFGANGTRIEIFT